MNQERTGKARVAAVIVTYNRLAKLKKTIEKTLSQTRPADVVYIIDNNSNDGTGDYLRSISSERNLTLNIVHLPENIGGAGGFRQGILSSYIEGADFIWLQDDDCYPEPTALEELLDAFDAAGARGHHPPFVCSRVLWTNGATCEMNNPVTHWNWAALYTAEMPMILVDSCSFVSVMFSRKAVEEAGLPIGDYFIWHDDTEYTRRCTRQQAGIQNLNSVVIHDLPANRGVNFGDITAANVWKFRYGARNVASYLMTHEGLVNTLKYFSRTRNVMRRAKVPAPLRRSIYKEIVRGAVFFRPAIERADELRRLQKA